MYCDLERQRKIVEMISKYEAFNDDEFYLYFNKWTDNEFGTFDDYMFYISNKVVFPSKSKFYEIYSYVKSRITQIERDKKIENLFWKD